MNRPVTIALVLAAAALAAAVAVQAFLNRGAAGDLRRRVSELERAVAEGERVAVERDRARLEREEAQEEATALAGRVGELEAEAASLREALARTRAERDAHLEARLALERRLQDALSLLATK